MKSLTSRTEIQIRFSEVDSIGFVWHGNYVHFFEDGREAFGTEFGLQYLSIYKNGFVTPIVHLEIDFKLPLMYGDSAIIETIYQDCDAAKLLFEYRIFRKSDNMLSVTGKTTQVFLDLQKQLMLTMPPFFSEWKLKYGLV